MPLEGSLIAIDRGPRFDLGRVVITAAAEAVLVPDDVRVALRQHSRGDWGELCADDIKENELSLSQGGRLVSVYRDRNATKFYIITEPDRSATTILLPEDY